MRYDLGFEGGYLLVLLKFICYTCRCEITSTFNANGLY